MNTSLQSDDFDHSISPVSLGFQNSELEHKYMEERTKITKPFKIVYLSTLCVWWIYNLRTLQVYFNFEYVTNPNNTETTIFLIGSLVGYCSMIIEMALTYFVKKNIFRGFIFTIPTCIIFLITTYQSNINLSTSSLYYPPIFVALLICFISMAFVYCYNWISGLLLIFLVLLSIDICNLIYPASIIDKAFISFYIFLAFICISSTLFYYEYQKRENFYNNYKMKIQKENTNRILNNLPLSIIVTENKKIIEVNKTFKELTATNQNSEVESDTSSKENGNDLRRNPIFASATENFKQIESGESLKQYIELSKEIEGSMEFNFDEHEGAKPIPFEITTTKLEVANGNQIIFSIKNMGPFHELNEIKLKQKYSRLFVASISHNFRTYLNIIMGNLDLFSSRFGYDNEQNFNLKSIRQASTFLFFLVQDLLDYSLLKEKQFQVNPVKFNFEATIDEILNLYEAKYRDKGLFLKKMVAGNLPNYIHSDKMRISQVLTNLLSNSWKFTLRGGVEIKLQYQEKENLMLISVKDTGIGIAPDNISKLMKPFSKIEDSLHLNENGIGLGLNICKKIAKKLEGSINISSKLNEGSEFIFAFKPFYSVNTDGLSEIQNELSIDNSYIIHEEQSKNLNNVKIQSKSNYLPSKDLNCSENPLINFSVKFCTCPKILIVDDEISNRMVISNYCNRLNIKSEEAINGLEALEKVEKFFLNFQCCPNYKLIVMDSNMPIMNGEESSLKIRRYIENQGVRSPYIICITANAINYKEELLNASEKIYDDVFYKPLRFDSFKPILQQYHLL